MFSVTEKAVNRMLLRSCEIASPGKSDFLSLRPDNHDAFSLTMWQGNGGADQRFVFVPVDETYHRILTLRKDAADRPFLGVERQSGEVVVGPHTNDGSQLFRVIDQDEGHFSIAACLAGVSLFAIGAVLSLFSGKSALAGGLRMAVIGAMAGGATYFIGSLVGGAI